MLHYMSMQVTVALGDDGPVAVKTATTRGDRERLHAEARRLRRADHPGVVTLVSAPAGVSGGDGAPFDGAAGDGTAARDAAGVRESAMPGEGAAVAVRGGLGELRTRYAGDSLERWTGTPAQAAGLCAAVAATVADLHAIGVVHGRIEAGHVLVGADGRPRLCGFSHGDGASPADDVDALGRLLASLVDRPGTGRPGAERPAPIPWRRSAADRRRLAPVVARACDLVPTRRPSARALAEAVLTAVPSAELPPPAPAEPPTPEPARPTDVAGAPTAPGEATHLVHSHHPASVDGDRSEGVGQGDAAPVLGFLQRSVASGSRQVDVWAASETAALRPGDRPSSLRHWLAATCDGTATGPSDGSAPVPLSRAEGGGGAADSVEPIASADGDADDVVAEHDGTSGDAVSPTVERDDARADGAGAGGAYQPSRLDLVWDGHVLTGVGSPDDSPTPAPRAPAPTTGPVPLPRLGDMRAQGFGLPHPASGRPRGTGRPVPAGWRRPRRSGVFANPFSGSSRPGLDEPAAAGGGGTVQLEEPAAGQGDARQRDEATTESKAAEARRIPTDELWATGSRSGTDRTRRRRVAAHAGAAGLVGLALVAGRAGGHALDWAGRRGTGHRSGERVHGSCERQLPGGRSAGGRHGPGRVPGRRHDGLPGGRSACGGGRRGRVPGRRHDRRAGGRRRGRPLDARAARRPRRRRRLGLRR